MLDHKYPDYPKQLKEHNYYRGKIAYFCFDLMKDKDSVPADVLIFLKEWWTNHIINVDMKYKLFFKEKGLICYGAAHQREINKRSHPLA